jgi:hypothetical protein
MKSGGKFSRNSLQWIRLAAAAVVLSSAAQAAQFQFGALIQAGIAGTGDWEIGVGSTAATPTSTASLTNQWVAGVDRMVQLEYLKPTNTVNVRVYDGATATGAFTQASYSPVGGNLVGANAIWTLPASSFFATATTGPLLGTSITVSNITLSGISGAVNVIQPIQQTTLTASRGIFGGTTTDFQPANVVFQGDSNGSWRLAATVNLNGTFGNIWAQGNQLALSLNAGAVDPVPEPSTFGMILLGGVLIAGGSRLRKPNPTSARS